jgi:hypothetical protein
MMKKIIMVVFTLLLCAHYFTHQYISAQNSTLTPQATIKLNSILKAYKPSTYTCLPPINRTTYNPMGGNERLQLACLLNGNKPVVLTEYKIADLLFGPDMDAILTHKNIKKLTFKLPHLIYDAIFYSPQGERDALLLLKSIFTKNDSDYLWGILLGYGQSNVELFYELDGFETWLRDTGYDGSLPDRSEFTIWPVAMKQKFRTFKKTWLHSPTYKKYKQDKTNAEQWIKAHAQFSVDDLYKQITPFLSK